MNSTTFILCVTFILDYADIELKDLNIVATVGIGGFGRVELVKYSKNNVVKIFALKQMKKQHIIDTKQEEHVYNERKIMLSSEFAYLVEYLMDRFI